MADEIEEEIKLFMSQEQPRPPKRARIAPAPAALAVPLVPAAARQSRTAAIEPQSRAQNQRAPPPPKKPSTLVAPPEDDRPQDEPFEVGEVREHDEEEPIAEIGAPPQPTPPEPVPMDDLPYEFRQLEIERRAVFKVLSHQIARAAADVKRLSDDFDDHYGQDSYAEASFVADKLIDLLYSMYEKQSQLTRAAQKVIVIIGKSLGAAEDGGNNV